MSKPRRIHIFPQDLIIKAPSGKNLMELLMDQGLFLRSDCGGKGICGKCRVKKILHGGEDEILNSCTHIISEDIQIEIPEASMLSSHITNKAPISFPVSFRERFNQNKGTDLYGIAADLGTTSIAVYLCSITRGMAISSFFVKNSQALYGDDVMSRIGVIIQHKENLGRLQKIAVKAIEWGIQKLLSGSNLEESQITQMVAVGNPTMIHILAGIDPMSIGISPYQPAFSDERKFQSKDLGFDLKNFSVQTLPHVSGFIGGDILAGALAVDFENQPLGTLLVDLGTNGELLLKGKNKYFATSCATGPAFEGASLSCGMQAIPGAIYRVEIKNRQGFPQCAFINPLKSFGLKPSGICGSGVISVAAQFCKKKIIEPGGAFHRDIKKYILMPRYLAAENSPIFMTQKDIRSVQLGKAALRTGIEFLLKKAGMDQPEKMIIAGAFGSSLNKKDMMTIGMIPDMDLDKVEMAGNSAGSGAIMVLCDKAYLEKSIKIASRITTVDLAADPDFQEVFIQNLNFPIKKN